MLCSAPDGEPILNPQVTCLYICNNNTEGRGGGVLVPARKVRDRGFVSCSGRMFRDRELVCSAVDQQGSISNPLSGGQ